jgi:hypothetical protein
MESPNPKGRPPKAREAALLAIGQEIINAQTWRAIVNKAALDALGKVVSSGQAVDDTESTASGRNLARVWIRDTFIGRPTEYIATDLGDSAFEQLAAYSADELAAVLATIEQIRNDGGGDPGGVDAAGETELGGS